MTEITNFADFDPDTLEKDKKYIVVMNCDSKSYWEHVERDIDLSGDVHDLPIFRNDLLDAFEQCVAFKPDNEGEAEFTQKIKAFAKERSLGFVFEGKGIFGMVGDQGELAVLKARFPEYDSSLLDYDEMDVFSRCAQSHVEHPDERPVIKVSGSDRAPDMTHNYIQKMINDFLTDHSYVRPELKTKTRYFDQNATRQLDGKDCIFLCLPIGSDANKIAKDLEAHNRNLHLDCEPTTWGEIRTDVVYNGVLNAKGITSDQNLG